MSELRNTVFQYFQTDDIPTEAQFQYTWSAIRFKDEKVSISDVSLLEQALQNKLGNSHANDVNAHTSYLAKLDASNLNYEQTQAWRMALGVGDIPDNVALVDEGASPEVYNKEQIVAMSMMIADFVTAGKIRADKIEALGLTDLIQASETSLSAFVANSANYEFQQNDFIAIPVNGNFSLFMFKGGAKNVAGNYLPTGLTNITIAMVEGLQSALNGKLDKPSADGNYFVNRASGTASFKAINPGVGYLLFWNGSEFKNSSIYRDPAGIKFGFGTDSPTEQLHLTARARMSALVLEDNAETLPQQVTYNNRNFYGTDATGSKRKFQYADYQDWLKTAQGMSIEQSLALAQVLNGGLGSAGEMSVNLIAPPIIQNQYDSVEYILLKGANLNLNQLSMGIQILASDKTTVVATIPNNQIQLNASGLDLIFYYNFYNFPEGQYFIKLTSGVKVYIASLDLRIVQSVTPVNLNALTWDILYAGGANPNPNDVALGGNFSVDTPFGAAQPIPKVNFKSSEIFAEGEDFLIELTINFSQKNWQHDYEHSFIGLGYSDTVNSVAMNSLVSFDFWSPADGPYVYINVEGVTILILTVPAPLVVTFIKTGNVFRTIIGGYNTSKTLSNNEGYSIFAQFVARPGSQIVSTSITKAYKL
ncbi:hypothetical protein OMO38_10230 [Chryseobacterium sp. 09-1422]|uniref:Uncharacterized protein n=1 Tax=Chryseobacterium kimseyorum TaxID=2984028 RepID=A0ABT3HYL6_9FLAO|nr:hypothetical protein [Chryseobacterium kimseyorum]MCW3168898.1 hypothetical protein [Chryseobacterium kimseyorum]